MQYQGIFFDLDGTLLPMDNDGFIRGYLGLLSKEAATWGYETEKLIPAMWKGVASMVKNDGSQLNASAFWATFAQTFGDRIYEDIPLFDRFYEHGFHQAKALTHPTPLAQEAVALAHEKGEKVVLATNPIFPEVAVRSRLGWAGLTMEDFDLVTYYTNSTTCKPNPAYYFEICGKLNLDPRRCLMIGNNAQEDAEAGMAAGLDAYLLTDWLINEKEALPDCPRGSFPELIEYLKGL